MIYLDTHVVVWLYAFGAQKFGNRTRRLIDRAHSLLISPMVLLEIQYLKEIGKLSVSTDTISGYLSDRIELEVCQSPFDKVIRMALRFEWSRDPFDRIITAYAATSESVLITKDKTIRDNYSHAAWD